MGIMKGRFNGHIMQEKKKKKTPMLFRPKFYTKLLRWLNVKFLWELFLFFLMRERLYKVTWRKHETITRTFTNSLLFTRVLSQALSPLIGTMFCISQVQLNLSSPFSIWQTSPVKEYFEVILFFKTLNLVIFQISPN